MARSLRAALVLLTLASPLIAQVHPEWTKTYDATPIGYDSVRSVAIAPSGNVYAAGDTGEMPGGPYGVVTAALVLKYDAAGALQWERAFPSGTYIDSASDVVVDPSSESVYVVGRADGSRTNGFLALKLDASGNLLWQSSFRQPIGYFERAQLRPNGNLVVAGYLHGNGGFVVDELTPDGHTVWHTVAPGGDYAVGLELDSADDAIVCGDVSTGSSNTISNMRVVKFSPSGAVLWTRSFTGGGSSYEIAESTLTDASGAIYVAGRIADPANEPLGVLIKLDANGNEIWRRTTHGTASGVAYNAEGLRELAFAPDGNVRVLGVVANVGTGVDLAAFEFTPDGALVWQNTWSGPGDFDEYLIRTTSEPDGSLTTVASTEVRTDVYALVVIRWNVDGTIRWSRIESLGNPQRFGVGSAAFGPDGAIASGGYTTGTNPNAVVIQVRQEALPFCFGDGASGTCPCNNQSAAGDGQGCANSIGAAARLVNQGDASLTNDTLVLTSSGELPTTLSVFAQGSAQAVPLPFGDGISCTGGNVLRLYSKHASAGSASAPASGDPTVSARSSALGDTIAAGSRRYYQVFYRDPSTTFCSAPAGSTFNASSALSILWVP
jgi:hypothetical protein